MPLDGLVRPDRSDSSLLHSPNIVSLQLSHRNNRKIRRRVSTTCLCKIFSAIVILSIVLVFLISLTSKSEEHDYQYSNRTVGDNLSHIHRKCKVPHIPLWSNAYSSASRNTKQISQCGNGSKFTKFFSHSTLKLLDPETYKRKNCTIFEIERPSIFPNDTCLIQEAGNFDEANEIHSLTSEHVIVSCDSHDEKILDFHSRVLTTQGFLPLKISHWKDKPKEDWPVNVMVLVLDSVSATDAFRNLPMTMKYLLEDLDFIYFSLFHALGEPTFINAMPILTGVPTHTFFKTKKWRDTWDETEFIWKHFHRSHFATAYMEDIPETGTFNYGGQVGFVSPPTDFYPRSFFTAWETLGGKTSEMCIGNSSVWKYLYDYELEILKTLNGILPSFTMPWLCWPFHDIFNTLSAIDSTTLNFFQSLRNLEEILENTVMIVMADHGFYSGEYAATHEGLLERRLPLFLMRVPRRLKELMPNVEVILEHNAKEVTSHYDVFKTLLQLSQLPLRGTNTEGRDKNELVEEESNKFNLGLGKSLLQWIPDDRTCQEAGIPKQWCICDLPEASSLTWTVPNAVQLHPGEPYVDRSAN